MTAIHQLCVPFCFFGCLTLGLSSCSTHDPVSADSFKAAIGSVERKCEPGDVVADTIELEKHVFESGSNGDLPEGRGVSDDNLAKGDLKPSFNNAFRTIMLGYADAVERSQEAGKARPRLLFYFNGGLNSQGDVEHQAKQQIPCMINDGYYPVFFIWDTNGLATYKEQITRVYDGHLYNAMWVRLLAPFHVASDILTGVGHAPADYFLHSRRFYRAVQRKPPCYLNVRTERIDGVECGDAQILSFVDNQREGGNAPIDKDRNVVIDTKRDKVDEGQREVARFIKYAALWPARMISTPLAHGFGKAAWENMLRRTRTTVRRSIEYYLDRHGYYVGGELIDSATGCLHDYREKQASFPQGTGAFARFFQMIQLHLDPKKGLPENKWVCRGTYECEIGSTDGDERCREENLKDQPATKKPADQRISEALKGAEITLIGHSMGAIVINELISSFPTIPYSDIVVMAAAASVRDTRATLDRYFDQNTEQSNRTRFYSLMLHPLNDTRERQYGGAVPSGSLLMWIDEMYEVPRVPNDKTFGFWPNAKSSRDFFSEDSRDRMLYRVFNRPDPLEDDPANPMIHGDFNNDEMCFWRPAFWGVHGTEWQERYAMMPDQALKQCDAEFKPKDSESETNSS